MPASLTQGPAGGAVGRRRSSGLRRRGDRGAAEARAAAGRTSPSGRRRSSRSTEPGSRAVRPGGGVQRAVVAAERPGAADGWWAACEVRSRVMALPPWRGRRRGHVGACGRGRSSLHDERVLAVEEGVGDPACAPAAMVRGCGPSRRALSPPAGTVSVQSPPTVTVVRVEPGHRLPVERVGCGLDDAGGRRSPLAVGDGRRRRRARRCRAQLDGCRLVAAERPTRGAAAGGAERRDAAAERSSGASSSAARRSA